MSYGKVEAWLYIALLENLGIYDQHLNATHDLLTRHYADYTVFPSSEQQMAV